MSLNDKVSSYEYTLMYIWSTTCLILEENEHNNRKMFTLSDQKKDDLKYYKWNK